MDKAQIQICDISHVTALCKNYSVQLNVIVLSVIKGRKVRGEEWRIGVNALEVSGASMFMVGSAGNSATFVWCVNYVNSFLRMPFRCVVHSTKKSVSV